jgi:hypothetical protein
MAKKKQTKKHKFKYSEPSSVAPSTATAGVVSVGGDMKAPTSKASASPVRDFSYVTKDMRRISLLVIVLVGIEILLWYLFGHSGAGAAVYRLIRT